jgi:RNA polymerase sigma-B factor
VAPHDPDDDRDLFRAYRASGSRQLRNQLVERHQGLVGPVVRRYERRGIDADDLRQVALIAVLKAVERFDPDYGVQFSTFATRTIEGELMRQLRDKGWAVRPPRRRQELYLAVRRAEEELIQRLGRSPTVPELARATGDTEDHVLEALEAGGARHASSLDLPTGAERPPPRSLVSDQEPGVAQVDVRMLVAGLMDDLDEREREVIRLRFFEELGQPEIAERLGLSQSYVSRLIRRTLEAMRDRLARTDADDDALGTTSSPETPTDAADATDPADPAEVSPRSGG